MSVTGITWFSFTSVPDSFNAPTDSRRVICTWTSASPVSTSEKGKSATLNLYSSLSVMPVTVLSAEVGASFTDVTVSVAMSVDELNAVVPPLFAPLVSTCWPTVPLVVSQAR